MDFSGHLGWEDRFVFMQVVAWGAMRCLSFASAMDGAGGGVALADALGFYCYLPSSYVGPLTLYEDYKKGASQSYCMMP